jgi:gas vesicle protein
MDQKQTFKQMIEFNRTTFNNAYNAMVLVQDQCEKAAYEVLDQATALPFEGRKAIENWSEAFKDGRKNLKQQMDNGFEQAEKLFVV